MAKLFRISPKIIIVFIATISLSLFLFKIPKNVRAFANDPNVIGPELPDPQAGVNVIDAQNFTGVVAVINQVTDMPHNTVPSKSNNPTILRLWVTSGTTASEATTFAQRLNEMGTSEFPNGALIVFGVELNNLEWWGNTSQTLAEAAAQYAEVFNALSGAISNHSLFPVAPAPPDLYNAVYDPIPWINSFNYHVDCNLVDTLAADVFDVPTGRLPSQYDRLNTWQFLQGPNGICPGTGKTVRHFEGWGTDPKLSVMEQVNFYNNTPLPPGIPTATTLIAPNCGTQVFDGTTWWYYIKGRVFMANGTEVDPATCGTSDGSGNPYIPTQNYCEYTEDQVRYPEFHSLRPYPACTWDPTIHDTNFYLCGHDLIATERLEIRYNGVLPNYVSYANGAQGNSCIATPDGSSVTCNYVITDRPIPMNIDLSNADFPIMGLTEGPYINNSVYRAFDAPGRLTPAQKMNEYVSWYLNGVLYRAEDNFPISYDQYPKKADWMTDADYKSITDEVQKVISFTGPLNKLLPLRIQQVEKMEEAADAGNTRHNQIAGCTYSLNTGFLGDIISNIQFIFGKLGILGDNATGVFKHIPGPCYPEADSDANRKIPVPIPILPDATIDIEPRRIASWLSHPPPDPEDPQYSNSSDYWRAYRIWRGEYCPYLGYNGVGIYFCYDPEEIPLFGRPNMWGSLFPYIPYSSTEDRVGFAQGYINFQAQLPNQPQKDVAITDINFLPTPGDTSEDGAFRNLYFPHMEEDTELAKILQSSFVPYQEKATWIDNPFTGGSVRGVYNTNRCEVLESRTNPGDDLFGENDNPGDREPINGNIEYSGTFSCTFNIPRPVCGGIGFPGQTHCNLDECIPYLCNADGSWTPAGGVGESPCSGVPGACISSSTYQQPEIAACTINVQTALSVYTATPKIEEAWERLVNGSMSVFKRIYPQTGPQTPVETIKDIPARTSATYTSTGEGGTTYAGDPGKSRPGSSAEIYFPHVGSIYDYFLKGIQTALRPKGYGGFTPSAEPDTSQPSTANCYPLTYNLPFRDTSVAPKDVESLIQYINDHNLEMPQFSQGGLLRMAANLRARYNEVVNGATAAGYNPAFALAIWIEETGAGAFSDHDFGCGTSSGFDSQFNCFLGLYDFYSAGSSSNSLFDACRTGDTPDFEEFMLFYSVGTCSTVQQQNFMRCSPYNWFERFLWFYNAVAA